MRAFIGVMAFLGAVLGGIILFLTMAGSRGAPQEAAGAAIAIAFAVIPYCIHGIIWREQQAAKSKPATAALEEPEQ